MKVSLVQMNSVSDKPAKHRGRDGLIEQAVAEEGPDWICLPECFDFMGGDRAAKFAAAEKLPDGPAYGAMQALAAKHRIFIHAGSILEKPEGGERIHNTTVVVRPRRRRDRALSQNPYVRRDDARWREISRKRVPSRRAMRS